jgi:hypothetical protein
MLTSLSQNIDEGMLQAPGLEALRDLARMEPAIGPRADWPADIHGSRMEGWGRSVMPGLALAKSDYQTLHC